MQLHTLDHEYRCQVPGYENTDLVVTLKGVTPREFDSMAIENMHLTPEGVSDTVNALVMKKVISVEGYGDIKTGKELYENGNLDIWDAIRKAVNRSVVLSLLEIKN